MEPFKNRIDAALVRAAASHVRRVHRAFPHDRFVRLATDGLGALELKARVQHVAAAFAATLPTAFGDAADVLEASLAPARTDTDLGALRVGDDGLAGWIVWPMTDFVATNGLGDPRRALRALHAMTQRFTAEYDVRPFFVAHRALVLATLREWVDDPSAHVRRLVSEGSRPRLPWGLQLKSLIADPSPTLPLLEALQDDPSDYVRRSVANHLNDVAKDHPGVVGAWLERHLPGASPERRSLLGHASRTLVKRGDARVLRAFGLGQPLRGSASLELRPSTVRIGAAVDVVASLRSSSRTPQSLVVDYRVHHVLASGATGAKVWKGWRVELAPREVRELAKKHSLRQVTTRRLRPGRHAVDLLVNGKVVANAAFVLRE